MNARLALVIGMALAAGGCVKHEKVASIDTLIVEQPTVATLTLDRSRSAEGTVVVAAAFGTAIQSSRVGAVTMRLSYDESVMTFDASSSNVSVLNSAMNADDGTVTIAAADVNGFPSTPVFNATFQLRQPAANAQTGTIRLTVDEVNGVDFTNQLPADASRLTVIAR